MARLIVFIVLFVVFLGFIMLNLENKSDLSLGFTTIKDIPVFLSSLSSFVLGMLVTIPLMLLRKRRKYKQRALPPEPEEKIEASKGPEKINKETSPYGID